MMHAKDAVYLIVRRIGVTIYQVLCAHHDAWRAEATLQSTRIDKAVGKGVAFEFTETLESQYGFSDYAFRWDRACDDGPSIDNYRAASALTLGAAAVLWRDDTAAVTQHFEQRRPLFNFDSARVAV